MNNLEFFEKLYNVVKDTNDFEPYRLMFDLHYCADEVSINCEDLVISASTGNDKGELDFIDLIHLSIMPVEDEYFIKVKSSVTNLPSAILGIRGLIFYITECIDWIYGNPYCLRDDMGRIELALYTDYQEYLDSSEDVGMIQ